MAEAGAAARRSWSAAADRRCSIASSSTATAGSRCAPPPAGSEFGARIAELRSRAADAGRGRIPVTLYGAVPKPAALESYAAAGVDRVLFEVPDAPADEVLRRLDELAGVGIG